MRNKIRTQATVDREKERRQRVTIVFICVRQTARDKATKGGCEAEQAGGEKNCDRSTKEAVETKVGMIGANYSSLFQSA